MDRFSPVAPARIRVLLLPVGRIERSRFLGLLSRLRKEASIVRLAEIHVEDERLSSLAPKALPRASLLFNYTVSDPSEQQQQHASPFELFRDPLLVLGVVYGLSSRGEERQKELDAATEYLRERHPRVVCRQLLLLDDSAHEHVPPTANTIRVVHSDRADDPSLRKGVQELSARFLLELATYTKAMQASPTIQTPGQTARSLQRPVSGRGEERRPTSGYASPTQESELSSPIGEDGLSRSPPRGLGSQLPATSFDQIQSASNAHGVLSRSDSRASNKNKNGTRASSQDRVSVHGFGASTSQEKARSRGKARVGIVIGHIHLMAGQWIEALRMLAEHSSKARALSDHLWHGKGLEGIGVCLLLHAWAGLDFHIPPICHLSVERTHHSHEQRLSTHSQADSQPESAFDESVRRLSVCLPDLLKSILGLYRSAEGSLELPFLVIAEATIRFCMILASLHNANGQLDSELFALVVENKHDARLTRKGLPNGTKILSRSVIADILRNAQPSFQDNVPVGDTIAILAGIASVYSLLHMDRKRAIVMKETVGKLTAALTQARKLGAAEMGIHPAASLSAETGADAILAIMAESSGVTGMMSRLAKAYGVELMSPPHVDESCDEKTSYESAADLYPFGNHKLKLDIMRDILAFCEASPDPYGVLRVTASILQSVRQSGPVDMEADARFASIGREEQVRLATTITRTIGVSKHLGLPDVQASYWDTFLVRNVQFTPTGSAQNVTKRMDISSEVHAAEQRASNNPLLYDPNASRPGTVAQQRALLVENEPFNCVVTLQNPLEISIEVEALSLITDGVRLASESRPFILGPMRLQQVSVSMFPCSAGEAKVIGCRVKVSGCREQDFPIFKEPWSATAPLLVKALGQDSMAPEEPLKPGCKGRAAERITLSATIVPPQPSLRVETVSILESSLMLLDGEKRTFDIVLRNISNLAASVFEVVGTAGVLRLVRSASTEVHVGAGDTISFEFEVTGRAGLSNVQADFQYCSVECASPPVEYVRMLSVPIETTVNAALQVQHVDVSPSEQVDSFVLSFDLGNGWPKPLSYRCSCSSTGEADVPVVGSHQVTGLLGPGEVERIHLTIVRWHSLVNCDSAEDTLKELRERVRISWRGDARVGDLDLSGLVLSSGALDMVRGARIHLSTSLVNSSNVADGLKPSAKVGSFVTLRSKLVNRAAEHSVPLSVQLHIYDSGGDAHHERHIAIIGPPYRLVPPVVSMADVEVDFAICPLMRGTLELRASVTPAALPKAGSRTDWHTESSLTIHVE